MATIVCEGKKYVVTQLAEALAAKLSFTEPGRLLELTLKSGEEVWLRTGSISSVK